jgi:hypothetical protein
MQQYDYNGVLVNKSQPTKVLRKVTRYLTIDSNDRDPALYVKVNGGAAVSDAGDYVVYLPRVYERVTKITLKSAMVQAPVVLSTAASTIGFQPTDSYVLLSLEGLNRKDETAPGGDRAGYIDSWFAKLPNDVGVAQAGSTIAGAQSSGSAITYTTVITHGFFVGQTICITGCSAAAANLAFVQVASVPSTTTFTVTSTATFNTNTLLATVGTAFIPGTLFYNDQSYDTQHVDFTPPISRLQRLHVTLRRHTPFGGIGLTTPLTAPITFGASQNSFTFEIEYLDNGFDDFSTMQTRLAPDARERA